jgi:hypothetical protein
MNSEIKVALDHIVDTNTNAERAYWCALNISAETAHKMGINQKLQTVLSLLNRVDDITMDIIITINKKDDGNSIE